MNNAISIYAGNTLTVGTEIAAGAVCIDCTADTSLPCSIQVVLTNGTTAPGSGRTVTLYYAWVGANIGSNIPATTQTAAENDVLTCSPVASQVSYFKIDTTKRGKYLCVWYDHRNLDATVTLAASLLY